MMRKLSPFLYTLGLIAAVAVGYALHGQSNGESATTEPAAADETSIVSVTTSPVRHGSLDETSEAYGIVESDAAANAIASVPFEAVVKGVLVRVGQSVEAGDKLASLTASPDALLQLRQSAETLSAAQRTFDQVQERLKNQLATNADLAQAQQILQTAKIQAENFKSRDIGSEHTLTAKAAGVITAISAQPGQLLPAGTAIATLRSDRARQIRIGVDPSVIGKIHVGSAVMLKAISGGDPAEASVKLIADQIDPQTRLRDVLTAVPEKAGWVDGTFVHARIVTSTVEGMVVPRDATRFDDGRWIVFVVKDGRARRIEVTIALGDETSCVVTADNLHEGEAVITQSSGDLDDNAAISPTAATEPATEPATAPTTEPATAPTTASAGAAS